MAQLRFTAVHEDGDHLVLSSPEGTEFLLPVDERLRAALRQRSRAVDAPATPLRPRDVQAMIRAGQSPEEVAEITGWPAERVARFEAPILAERAHISRTAQAAHVRGRAVEGVLPTLGARVEERLTVRGVDTDNTSWDASRPEGGRWTVLISFVAGQRQRSAAWRFDPVARTVEALDDEARWLSEDEQALPGSATAGPLLSATESTESVDLMTAMRERSRSRGRRRKTSTSPTDPAGLPGLSDAPDQVLPLEDLAYDPDTMGPPPAAHGAPERPAGTEAAGASPEAGGDDARSEDAQTTEPAKTAEAVSYDIALDFDEDEDQDEDQDEDSDTTDEAEGFEVDQSPQDATLADLFGSDEEYDDEPDDLDVAGPAAPEGADRTDTAGTRTDAAEEGPDDTGDTPAEDEDAQDEAAEDAGAQDKAAADDAPTPKAEPESPRRRKDGRPGVPSWDDIMFGAKSRR